MIKNKGNIEILLLLCCIVGVVAFFSLSLSLTNAFLEKDRDELLERWHDLGQEKAEKEARAKILEEEKSELEMRMKEREKPSTLSSADPEEERKIMEEEINKLNKEYDHLQQRVQNLRKEFSSLSKLPDPQSRSKKEKKLKDLKEKLAQLEERIREKNELLSLLNELPEDPIDKGKDVIEKELVRLRKKRRSLEENLEILNGKIITAGTSQFKNPLYVDCRKNAYIFYPSGEAVIVSEREKRNRFKERSAGHDVIVLYVRPDGIESFYKAYTEVKAMSIARSYEPIEADQSLDFLKRNRDEGRDIHT